MDKTIQLLEEVTTIASDEFIIIGGTDNNKLMKCKLSNFPNQSGGNSSSTIPEKERYFTDQEIRDLYGKRFFAIGIAHDEFVQYLTNNKTSLIQGNQGAEIVFDKALEHFQSNDYDWLEEYYPYYHGGMATT